jgi:hypothetical protein
VDRAPAAVVAPSLKRDGDEEWSGYAAKAQRFEVKPDTAALRVDLIASE